MKRFKYIVLALVAAFALASHSKAIPYTLTTNNSKLTISMRVATNAPYTVKNGVTTYTVVTAKITNKDLLALFAQWDGTTWPAGSQLVVGWDEPWEDDVLVVDKTGTNVLFDASSWDYPDQYFSIDFFDEEGAYTETDNENRPGSDGWIWLNQGDFTLFDDTTGTDISGSGPCTEDFTQKWDKNHNYSGWSDSEKFSAAGAGSDEEINSNSFPTISVTITAKGKGTGENSNLY